MRLGLAKVMVGMVLAGCGASDSAFGGDTEDFIDMDSPPGNCSAETGADPCPAADSSGSPEGEACNSSQGCVQGTSCVAPFEDGQAGDFTCTSECIVLGDETAWCLDDTACCDPMAVCTSRGLCDMPPAMADDSGTATGGTGTGTETDGTAGSTGATEGSSSGSGSGSGTGATTGTTGM